VDDLQSLRDERWVALGVCDELLLAGDGRCTKLLTRLLVETVCGV
jgi:hypothetical protein